MKTVLTSSLIQTSPWPRFQTLLRVCSRATSLAYSMSLSSITRSQKRNNKVRLKVLRPISKLWNHCKATSKAYLNPSTVVMLSWSHNIWLRQRKSKLARQTRCPTSQMMLLSRGTGTSGHMVLQPATVKVMNNLQPNQLSTPSQVASTCLSKSTKSGPKLRSMRSIKRWPRWRARKTLDGASCATRSTLNHCDFVAGWSRLAKTERLSFIWNLLS